MANLTESPIYEPGIFQLEKSTPPLGGAPVIDNGVPSAGHANAQGLQLANRTAWLKQQVDTAGSATILASDLGNNTDPTKGAGLVGFDGGSVYDVLKTSKALSDYAALRLYDGPSTVVRILTTGVSGLFYLDTTDTTSVDNGGTTLVGSSGKRWKRSFDGNVKAEWFIFSGSDIGPATNKALIYSNNIRSNGIVELPSGSFTTSVEIKLPDFTVLKGQGIDKTIIKAVDALPVNQNVITNLDNTRVSRSTYNQFIGVQDLTVNGNYQGRDPSGTGTLDDQGCGINFSSVRNSFMRKVKAINCPLHCLDVMASVYLNDGNINNQPLGPSLDIIIENCIGVDPQRDDAITTHNSGRIQISNCQSFFNGTPGDTQQGFEIDEGSWAVSVTDCYAKNFQKGFQVKGHDTTIPARDVQFVRCTAEDCTYSFECSHLQVGTVLPAGQIYWARNAVFVDCVSINVKPSTIYAQAKDLSINGYIGTTVRNLTVYGTQGILAIDKGADHVHIKGVKFKDGSTLTGAGNGRIYIYAPSPAVPNGQTVTIEDVVCETPISCALIRATSSACRKRIRNITAYGSDSTVPMLALNIGSNDDIGDIYQVGFLCAMQPTGNTAYLFDNTLRLQPGLRYSMAGSAAPEGVVTAPVASIYQCTGNGNIYRKSTAASPFNTGWVAM